MKIRQEGQFQGWSVERQDLASQAHPVETLQQAPQNNRQTKSNPLDGYGAHDYHARIDELTNCL